MLLTCPLRFLGHCAWRSDAKVAIKVNAMFQIDLAESLYSSYQSRCLDSASYCDYESVFKSCELLFK